MQKHRLRLRMGDVSSSQGDGYVSIEIEDVVSGIQIIDIDMPYAAFGKLVKGCAAVLVDATIKGLDNIGKKYTMERRSVVCAEKFDVPWRMVRDAKEQWLRDNCQEEGWYLSAYLGSQNSITNNRDGTETFHYHVYKYVDITEEERQALLGRPGL